MKRKPIPRLTRIAVPLCIAFALVIFTGCVSSAKYNDLEAENESLRVQKRQADMEKATVVAQKETLESQKELLNREVADKDKQIEELSRLEKRFTPVTWEIINLVEGAGKNIKELDYYLSTPLTLVTNSRDLDIQTGSGKLVIVESNKSEQIEMTSEQKGVLNNFIRNPMDRESLEVFFPYHNITLKFERRTEKNWFEPVSVINSAKNYILKTDGMLPHLRIYADYFKDSEWDTPIVQNISSVVSYQRPMTPPPPPQNQPSAAEPVLPLNMPVPLAVVPPTRNIVGPGMLKTDTIVAYIQSRNDTLLHRNIEAVIGVYIAEAQREQINHDIAIAQMCEGTDFLSNLAALSTHNYGDLQKIGNREARFPDMQTGIRAHIQQLKAYASRDEFSTPPVDRTRLNRIRTVRGRVRTLDDLFPYWVTKDQNNYRNTVNSILNDMYSWGKI